MKEKLAIIGSGIAGMGCAHFLQKKYEITILEKNNYIGGHTNTVDVEEEGKQIPIDTGFIVFNHETYPNLKRLFDSLKVPTKKAPMSFSVQHVPTGLEFCGSSLNGLFAQRKNLFNLRYVKMLLQINRFNVEAPKILDNPKYENYTLQQYIEEEKFGNDIMAYYLLPMSSAVWSTPLDLMLQFPAISLIRFFYNHGFLGLSTQHQWYTVDGGSREYVKIITAPFKNRIRLNSEVKSVARDKSKVTVEFKNGKSEKFDKVIFASHADATLKMLKNPTAKEKKYLKEFKYQKNIATLHTDESIMPETKMTWSSWNYKIQEDKNGILQPSTIYWMNSLQGVSNKKNYFVSINDPGTIDPKKIIKTIIYDHPLFYVKSQETQKYLPELNEGNQIFFCGSYFKYGFHEDAFASAVHLSGKILGKSVWD